MARSILTAVSVALLSVIGLFVVNLGLTNVPPEHYRKVVEEAVRNGTMTQSMRQLFAPERTIYLVGGSDCLILVMLIMPREAPIRASISPRMPVVANDRTLQPIDGFSPDYFCGLLGRVMAADAGGSIVLANHHRYLHGAVTVAALMLAVVPLEVAARLMLLSCFAALIFLAIAATARMRSTAPSERRRGLAFLIIAVVLAAFYALPVFGRSFAHGPTDLLIIGFILFSLSHPLCRITESRFVVVVSVVAAAVVVLELLTGGLPTALATMITMVALGNAPSAGTLWRRLVIGVACFGAVAATSFAVKLSAIAIIWDSGEVASFFSLLSDRMIGSLAVGQSPALEKLAENLGIDIGAFNASVIARLLIAGAMIGYSSFLLAWGSHFLGAALVVLPIPILFALTCLALWRVGRNHWAYQVHPMLLVAGLVPLSWYAIFTTHTAVHSFFMVRPLALNVALAAIAGIMMPPRQLQATAVHDSQSAQESSP